MSTIKRLFLSFFCVLIVLSSFIFSASAVDSTYTFNCSDPAKSGFDGFIVVPVFKATTNIPAVLVAWTITPVGIKENEVSSGSITYPELASHFVFDRESFSITFTSPDTVNSYLVTWFYMFNGDTAPTKVETLAVTASTRTISFTASHFGASRFLPPSFFGGISSVNSFNGDQTFTYNCLFNSDISVDNRLASIYSYVVAIQNNLVTRLDITNSRLLDIINHFSNLLLKVDYTNEQLDTIVSQFTELIEVSYSISGTLDDFVYYYWDEFANVTFLNGINAIAGRLDLILRALNRSGDTEQTTADTSNIDNYVDIEQSLVNNDEAESAINDFDISISGKGYSFIWDLITRIFNTHPEVFGLVIAILTLGFIALLLNR